MNLQITDEYIPGTVLRKHDMGNVTGLAFLHKIFYITDGIMLNQIREISGIDGTTLQNWTKRGWVECSKHKKYDIEQVAHILLINMLRSCMQLDHISFLVQYVNGVNGGGVSYTEIYDYACRVLDKIMTDDVSVGGVTLRRCILAVTADRTERPVEERKRLTTVLEIVIMAYYAALIKGYSDSRIAGLIGNE